MHQIRPPEVLPPPEGWIYVHGPLTHRINTRTDLMWWVPARRVWEQRRMEGNAGLHYAVREGSRIAIENGLLSIMQDVQIQYATPAIPEWTGDERGWINSGINTGINQPVESTQSMLEAPYPQQPNRMVTRAQITRPAEIDGPPQGFSYVHGPLPHPRSSTPDVIRMWEAGAWSNSGFIAGNSRNCHYAVADGSELDLLNGIKAERMRLPEGIPAPPEGWIYQYGSLDVQVDDFYVHIKKYHDFAWTPTNDQGIWNGNSRNSHYAVRADSALAYINKLQAAPIVTPEQIGTITIRSIMREYMVDQGIVEIVTEPYHCSNGKFFGKGIMKKALSLAIEAGLKPHELSKNQTKSRREIASRNSRPITHLISCPPQALEMGARQFALKMRGNFTQNRKVCVIVPRHFEIGPAELSVHNNTQVKFHVL